MNGNKKAYHGRERWCNDSRGSALNSPTTRREHTVGSDYAEKNLLKKENPIARKESTTGSGRGERAF